MGVIKELINGFREAPISLKIMGAVGLAVILSSCGATPTPAATSEVTVTPAPISAQSAERVVEQIDIQAPNGLIFSFSKIPPESGLTKVFLQTIIDQYCNKGAKVVIEQKNVPVTFVDDSVFQKDSDIQKDQLGFTDRYYNEGKSGLKSLAIMIDKDRVESFADKYGLELTSVYENVLQRHIFHAAKSRYLTLEAEKRDEPRGERLALVIPSLLVPKAEQTADQPVIKAPNDLIFYVNKIPAGSGLTKDVIKKYIDLYSNKDAKVMMTLPIVQINFVTELSFKPNPGVNILKEALGYTGRVYGKDGLEAMDIHIFVNRVEAYAKNNKLDVKQIYEKAVAEEIFKASTVESTTDHWTKLPAAEDPVNYTAKALSKSPTFSPTEAQVATMNALVQKRRGQLKELDQEEGEDAGVLLFIGGVFPGDYGIKKIHFGWDEPCFTKHLRAVYFPTDETKGLVVDCGSATPLETLTADQLEKLFENGKNVSELPMYTGNPIYMLSPMFVQGSDLVGIKWEGGLISYLHRGHMQVKRERTKVS